MNAAMRLLHFFGFVAWIGGSLGVMAAGIAMKKLDRSLWGGVADAQANIYRMLIGPGSITTIVTGFALTMENYHAMSLSVSPWLMIMQFLGIAAALVTLLGAMPAAGKITRLEPVGPSSGAFDAIRRKMVLFGMIGGTLAFGSLIAGAMYRLS